MAIFNFNDLSKQSKIGYNALYNVVFAHSTSFNAKDGLNRFTVPLCLNSDNKVSLTEKNFIFFDSVLSELKLFGFYNIVSHNGRAVDDVKTDFSTVEIVLSKEQKSIIDVLTPIKNSNGLKNFDFADIDTTKLLKRDGKAEKAKTAENTAKKEADAKTVEEAKQIVENAKQTAEVTAEEEIKNEEKVMQRKADALNADTVATIYETTIRRIGLVLGVKWEDMDKKQKNAIKDALKDHVKMLETGSVM